MSQSDFKYQLDSSAPVTRRVGIMQAIHLDAPLLGGLLVLITVGLFVLYSASGQSVDTMLRQMVRMVIGFAGMMTLAFIPPRVYKRWTPWLFGIGICLLIGVLVTGTEAKGAQRWLAIPGLGRFQPSEIMKVIVPMMLSWYLAERALPPGWKPVVLSTILILIPTLLIAKQPDLGTAILIASSGLIVLFLSGLNWKYIAGLFAAAIPAGGGVWMVMHDYQRQRVLTFLNPELDRWGSGWNIMQSKTAIGSGGWEGKGWLHGTQAHLDFLPESSTDFIIAVLAEEFGLLGVCALLMIYFAIVARGIYIAINAQDTYSRLLAGSITLTFFVYVFVNIGMVSGILPVVGVPLPMVSYGGTSVVTLMASFGILMSIQTHRKLLAT
ncbi:rod shape-determining protein RodA [Ketobacter sp. MCCC 1A13808]|uniref:rod shape-determining protein RodA n=1 Tax=Ketobacter sp. MCCC 1A13808 TaxID=2602738 RepID=UPI000F11EFF2|nr:rod shape-determining protein RodA [Ketobacter sp. MCCC 1A13808]MVF13344.1 rod shape-determining protein RodA [Ketobacter sp. MCCC 1A13808]RLP54328.1 MAG: rod shape-determining protein RodA [Ketobacter sp.]